VAHPYHPAGYISQMGEHTPPLKHGRYIGLGLAGIVVLAAVVFLTGITWGLPSRKIDPYLFGGRPAWPGTRIAELVKADQRNDTHRGADVDVNPLGPTTQPVALNDTDAKRAAIILRYRLYTNQPDEMVTMMALASMKPGQRDFDPKLYQYGGLFVYPIGVMLKVCSLARLVTLKSDLTYYLDHPEEFGRFYVVARCYVAAFGLAGVLAVFRVARRIAEGLTTSDEATPCEASGQDTTDTTVAHPQAAQRGDDGRASERRNRNPKAAFAGIAAALLYVFMPVVINMAHEAKPHLPGAVLMLFAVLAAMRYVERGAWRWLAITGVLCGAAFGMVLSCWPVFVVIPLMTLLHRMPWSRRVTHTVVACVIGVVVYFATNPYVLINLFVNPDVLRSNLGNTLAMFPRGGPIDGLRSAAGLIAEGTSPLLAQVGAVAAVFLCILVILAPHRAVDAFGSAGAVEAAPLWLLLAPAAILFVQFAAAGAGKPGEYGRFAIFVDITLAIAAAALLSRIWIGGGAIRVVFLVILVVATTPDGLNYLKHFVIDAAGQGARGQCARRIADVTGHFGPASIAVFAEPAPYCMPPVDVIGNRLYLFPRVTASVAPNIKPDIVISPCDLKLYPRLGDWTRRYKVSLFGVSREGLRFAPISWADKPFALWLRQEWATQEVTSHDAH
jgi:hypothetical protein